MSGLRPSNCALFSYDCQTLVLELRLFSNLETVRQLRTFCHISMFDPLNSSFSFTRFVDYPGSLSTLEIHFYVLLLTLKVGLSAVSISGLTSARPRIRGRWNFRSSCSSSEHVDSVSAAVLRKLPARGRQSEDTFKKLKI